jgi:hypothetical protein
MLTLHKELSQPTTPQEKIQTERSLAATDREIDSLVYALYGLTEKQALKIAGILHWQQYPALMYS